MENKKFKPSFHKFRVFKTNTQINCTLFLVCCFQIINAQSVNIDSLTKIIEGEAAVTVRIETAKSLVRQLLYVQPDQASVFAEQMLNLAQTNNLPIQQADALVLLGLSYEYRNAATDSVLTFFEEALEIAQNQRDDVLAARTYYSMAGTYQRMGQLDTAFKYNQKALKIAKEYKEQRLELITTRQIAIILELQKSYAKAINYYQNGLAIAIKTDDTELIGVFANNIGSIYYLREQLDSALIFFEQSLDIMNTHHSTNKFATSTLTVNIGNIYRREGKYELAHQYLIESYQIAKEANYVRGVAAALSNLSELYFDQEQYAEAIDYAKEGLEVLGNTGQIKDEIALHGVIKNSYTEQGKYKAAIEEDKIYEALKDSLYELESKKQIEELDTKYNFQQKELENEMLKAEQHKQILISRQRTAIGIAGVVLAALMSIIAMMQRRTSNLKKRQNEILEEKVAERTRALNKANYELKTFNYIASHDIKEPIRNIGSYAGLIFRKLPDTLKQEFDFYFKTIKNSSQQLYTLVEDISKYSQLSQDNDIIEKQEVNLNETVDSLIFGLDKIIRRKKGKVTNEGLPNIQANASLVYTILKNLIENGLKYNQSDIPEVKLSATNDEQFYYIQIKDNGIGIKEEYHEQIFEMFKRLHTRKEYLGSGIGLAIVKLLTDKLDIALQLKSELGQGTTFILSIPK